LKESDQKKNLDQKMISRTITKRRLAGRMQAVRPEVDEEKTLLRQILGAPTAHSLTLFVALADGATLDAWRERRLRYVTVRVRGL
jgi:hypothetical protein